MAAAGEGGHRGRRRHGRVFITYALAKLVAGKFADAKPAVLVLALVFALKFAVG